MQLLFYDLSVNYTWLDQDRMESEAGECACQLKSSRSFKILLFRTGVPVYTAQSAFSAQTAGKPDTRISAKGRSPTLVESVERGQAALTETPRRTNDSVMATTLIGAHGLEHVYGHSFPVLVTALYDDLGLDPIQAGVLSAVRQITGGLTSVGSGFSVDMFQHRRAQVLSVSMALIGVGYFLVSIAPTYTLIVAALVVASAGSALRGKCPLASPCSGALGPAIPPPERTIHIPSPLHRQRGRLDWAIGSWGSAGNFGLALDHGRGGPPYY